MSRVAHIPTGATAVRAHLYGATRQGNRCLQNDITVYQSDRHRAPGHLSRQGPPALRWALYEAAQRARFPNSPDRAWYLETAERLGGNRACLALARKLLKRCYHTLRELGEDALAPPAEDGLGSAAARRASSRSTRQTQPPADPEPADALAA